MTEYKNILSGSKKKEEIIIFSLKKNSKLNACFFAIFSIKAGF